MIVQDKYQAHGNRLQTVFGRGVFLLMRLGPGEEVDQPDIARICGRMTFRTTITGYMSTDRTIDGNMAGEATIHGYMEADSCQ